MNKKLRKVILAVVFFIMIYLIFKIKVIASIIELLGISFILSYILRPIVDKLISFGLNRKFSALIIILAIFGVVFSMALFLIPAILMDGETISNTMNNIREITDIIYAKLQLINENQVMRGLIASANDKITEYSRATLKNSFDKLLGFSENILSYAVIPVIIYYFLSETPKICHNVSTFIPIRSRSILRKICRDIDKVLGRYIISQFILCLLITILTFIILMFLKVDYSLILAVINGFFNIIPYFGPLFGAIPAILIALIKSPQTAIWTAVWLYLIQQLEGDIISPKITGDSINMHPLIVILLLIVGGKVGGFIGMVLAIPIGVIIKIIYDNINYYLF
jgi:predicted PurR-regulated permease PerM